MFNPKEIKIEQMLDDEAIGNTLPGFFGPSSSRVPRGQVLTDEAIDCLLEKAFGTGSSRAAKRRTIKGQALGRVSTGRAQKKLVPDPPWSTLCTKKSLETLRHCFHISEGVDLLLPASHQGANDPPVGCMTLYMKAFSTAASCCFQFRA